MAATPSPRTQATKAPSALYEGFDYESFWSLPGRGHLDALEHSVVRDLLPAKGRRILDAGCGYGRLADAYGDRFDEVVLMDPAWSMLEIARDRLAGRTSTRSTSIHRFTLVAADLQALPFRPRSFQAVAVIRVLHHFRRPGVVVAALQRILCPAGRLVFNISNKRNLARIARFVFQGEGPDPFAPGLVPYGPHAWGCHPADARNWMRDTGRQPIAWRGVGVTDKLAGRAGAFASLVPEGRLLARALGVVQVAPSIFCAAQVASPVAQELSAAASEVPGHPFACPLCRVPVGRTGGSYACFRCSRSYPRRDGILDFRVEGSLIS